MLPDIFGETRFNDFFNFPFNRTPRAHEKSLMNTDIQERDNAYDLTIDLPGFSKEDITARLENGFLTIKAEKTMQKDDSDQKGQYIRQERYRGQCSRSFYVGENVTEEEISAKMEDGILKLTVPKKETKKRPEKKYIAIE